MPSAAQDTIDVAHDGFWGREEDLATHVVDCRWHFEDRDHLEVNLMPGQQIYAAALDLDTYYVERGLFRGYFSPTHVHARLAAGAHRALENLTRTAAILQIMPTHGLVFHAATLVFDGQAYLVAGPSGAGKSTISREGGAERVLTPELSILRADPEGRWTAMPSPFWGHHDRSQWAEPAPLAAAMVLSHGKTTNTWRRVEGARAVGALMPHIGAMIAPQAADPRVLRRVVSLIQSVPTYELAWARGTHPLEGAPWIPSP